MVSLNVRSNLPKGHPIVLALEKLRQEYDENGPSRDYFSGEARQSPLPYLSNTTDFDDDVDELPYLRILNGSLPDNICVYQWSPVEPSFSARFDARFRQYKYFFPRLGLDVEAMQKAASYFLGSHDFRNFCKFDPGKSLTNWDRTVMEAHIDPWTDLTGDRQDPLSSNQMMAFTVKGKAFLWHQVRSMMAILFLVGERKEKPELVLDMLDVHQIPFKPMYEMAPEFPLVLWECGFRDNSVHFRGEDRVHHGLAKRLIDTHWRHQMATACITGGFVNQVLRRGHGSLVYPGASGLSSQSNNDNDSNSNSNNDSNSNSNNNSSKQDGSKYLPYMETASVLEEKYLSRVRYTPLLKKEMSTNSTFHQGALDFLVNLLPAIVTLEERSKEYLKRKAARTMQKDPPKGN